MGIGQYLGRMRNYFSRDRSLPIQDERGRNAQVGYKQKENLFDKFLNASGRLLKYIGFTAAALTVVGAVAIGVQYLRNDWPFRAERENAYVITRNAINEKPARPLRQGVNVYVPPIIRIVEENGQPVKITGEIQSAETPDFTYRSSENYRVNLKTQYNFQVTTPEGAAKVHWDYGGIDSAKETLDTIVENALLNVLSKVPAKAIASEHREAIAGEILSLEDHNVAEGGELVNYLIEAENKANEVLRKERMGIFVTNFAISNPQYTPGIENAWEATARKEALIVEEEGKAKARIIKAESEAKEAKILAEATKTTFPDYIELGETLANKVGRPELAIDLAMALHERDNTQQIANSGGRILYAPNSISGTTKIPPIQIQNIGQTEPRRRDA